MRPSNVPNSAPSMAPSVVPSPVPSSVPSNVPTKRPTSLPTMVPSPGPTKRPSRGPTDQPSSSPTKSFQPSVFCVAVGDFCTANDICCGEGSNGCVGVCSRVARPRDTSTNKDQFIIGSGTRQRGSGSTEISDLGRVGGSARRKALKGSNLNTNREFNALRG
jgi:hypothetical protein